MLLTGTARRLVFLSPAPQQRLIDDIDGRLSYQLSDAVSANLYDEGNSLRLSTQNAALERSLDIKAFVDENGQLAVTCRIQENISTASWIDDAVLFGVMDIPADPKDLLVDAWSIVSPVVAHAIRYMTRREIYPAPKRRAA